jgi:catechol 2,3-dioxygenase
MSTSQSTSTSSDATTGAQLPAATSLGTVTLTVRDVAGTATWYERALGLVAHVDEAAGHATLRSEDGPVVIELMADPRAEHEEGHAGLYHIALNTSDRPELARMIRRLAETDTPISGASDHGTHEALYLNDFEGNGLELAVDRSPDHWGQWGTEPLDLDDLFSTITGEPFGPQRSARGVRVGHLHLQTGDLPAMRDFYTQLIGFEIQFEMPTACFVSAGGYHHHLGFNTWAGVGAPPQTPGAAGLHHWRIQLPAQRDIAAVAGRLDAAGYEFELLDSGHTIALADPSGMQLRLSCREA